MKQNCADLSFIAGFLYLYLSENHHDYNRAAFHFTAAGRLKRPFPHNEVDTCEDNVDEIFLSWSVRGRHASIYHRRMYEVSRSFQLEMCYQQMQMLMVEGDIAKNEVLLEGLLDAKERLLRKEQVFIQQTNLTHRDQR